jgi:small-conductance mechanosensitive channel
MASLKQTSFTALPLALNTAARRFRRGLWGIAERPSTALGQRSRRVGRRRAVVLLGVLTLLLTLVSPPSSAQSLRANGSAEAPVVVDGRVLFKVRNSGNFTAAERAAIINSNLEQEVQSPKAVKIEVVQENRLTIIRSRRDVNATPASEERDLVTITEGDVIPGTSPIRQANIWRDLIEEALRQGQLERTPVYYRQAWLYSIGVLLGAIALHFSLRVLGKLASHQLKRWLGHPASPLHPWEPSAKLFLQLALLGLEAGLWTAVGFYITDIFPQARSWRYKLFNFLTSPIVSLGESNYSALQLLVLLAFTIGLWFAVSGLTRIFKFYVLSRTGAELRVQEVVAILTQYVLTFLGLIVLLQIWGLDVRSLAILASVLGVGIGFGVQNITNNLISGLIITLERPIQVGDFVKVGDLVGTVERIGARSTEIRTLDQVTIIVPNSRFLETEVINWSHGDPVSRLRIPVGVAYGSNVEQVQAALLEAAKSHPEVLVRPQPQVWFQEFGESAINFDLLVWTGEPKNQARVKSDLYYRIEASLRRYGIEVPFPQRDLNVRSPQLEEFIAAWLRQNAPTPPEKAAIESPNGDKLSVSDRVSVSEAVATLGASAPPKEERTQVAPEENQPQDSSVVASVEPLTEQSSATAPSGKGLAAVDIEALVTAMREPGGLEIKDRRDHLNFYPACFIGSEAVEWLVQTQNCTREEAIQLGQILIERGIIHHVLDEYPFRDDYFFYSFYVDEESVSYS